MVMAVLRLLGGELLLLRGREDRIDLRFHVLG